MPVNVMNTTHKRIRDRLRPLESHYIQDWSNRRLLPFFRCFAGRKCLYRNTCLQNENFKETNQHFHSQYGHMEVVKLYRYSWPISGVLGNALCMLIPFLFEVSLIVSVLIAVDGFGVVMWPLHSQLISLKRCTFFILATWIVAMASTSLDLFAYSLEKKGKYFVFISGKKPLESPYHLLSLFLPIT